jgi:hypothetical protein
MLEERRPVIHRNSRLSRGSPHVSIARPSRRRLASDASIKPQADIVVAAMSCLELNGMPLWEKVDLIRGAGVYITRCSA